MAMAYIFAGIGILGALLAFGIWALLGGQGRLEIAAYCTGTAMLFYLLGRVGLLR